MWILEEGIFADSRTAKWRQYAELIERGPCPDTLHWAATVKVQGHLTMRNVFLLADLTNHFAGPLTVLQVIGYQANDVAATATATQIGEQLYIKK